MNIPAIWQVGKAALLDDLRAKAHLPAVTSPRERSAPRSHERRRPNGPSLPVVWHEAYEVDLGPHVFPTAKYRLVCERLLGEGTISERDIVRPEPAPHDWLALVHTDAYLSKIDGNSFSTMERMLLEVPYTAAVRDASYLSVGGAVACARLAMTRGVAVHLGGGFHHAFADHGEGFCVLNDVAVAIRVLQHEGAIRRALVIDLDVHHGNGTATIFTGDPTVFTFSMHQQANYPAVKPPSDLDIGLRDGSGDDEYLALLGEHLPEIVERHRPDLACYLAGADPYEHDQLGGLALTLEGLERRDRLVFATLAASRVPVAVSLAGGYAVSVADTVEIHCRTVRVARDALSASGGPFA